MPVLSAQAANLLLLCGLFCGFLAGGLRDPLLAAPVLACIALTALLGPRPAGAILRPWLYFLGWLVLSLCASPQPLTGLAVLSRWGILALFFCLAASQWGEAERRHWFWGLTACAAVLAACAVLVQVPGFPYVGILPPYYNYTCFVEAAFLCAAFVALLRKDGPPGLQRWMLGAVAAVALMEICWAHSRGALVAAAAGTGVFVWRHAPGRRLLPLAVALAAALAWTTWAKIDVVKAFKRPQIWRAAVQCTLDHPVLGAGPGQFANAFLKHNFPVGYGIGNYRARADHAHSEAMEALAEFGFPGLWLLLAALWAGLQLPPPERSTWVREAGLAAFVGMSAQCLIDNMFQLPALGLLYVSALAVARAPAVRKSVRPAPAELPIPQAPASETAPVGRPAWRALIWAGLLLAAGAWIPGWLVQGWQAASSGASDPGRRLGLLLRAVRVAPADPYLRENLYGFWLAQKPPQVEEALSQLAQAEGLSPFNAVYPVVQARLLRSRGDWPRVLELAGRAVGLEPDYLQARLLRAEALLWLGHPEEARGELLEIDRRSAALGARLNGGSGYEAFILGFDRAAYEELARSAAAPVNGARPRSG